MHTLNTILVPVLVLLNPVFVEVLWPVIISWFSIGKEQKLHSQGHTMHTGPHFDTQAETAKITYSWQCSVQHTKYLNATF